MDTFTFVDFNGETVSIVGEILDETFDGIGLEVFGNVLV